MADHVFLRESVSLAQFLNSESQGAEELAFINHATYVENIPEEHHEQISCRPPSSLFRIPERSLRFVRKQDGRWETADEGT